MRVKQGGGHQGHNGLAILTGTLDRITGGSALASAAQQPAMDVKSWVLADFTKTETSGWLPDLLGAISDEAPAHTHDDSGFMSRVAFGPIAKPPQNEMQ